MRATGFSVLPLSYVLTPINKDDDDNDDDDDDYHYYFIVSSNACSSTKKGPGKKEKTFLALR